MCFSVMVSADWSSHLLEIRTAPFTLAFQKFVKIWLFPQALYVVSGFVIFFY